MTGRGASEAGRLLFRWAACKRNLMMRGTQGALRDRHERWVREAMDAAGVERRATPARTAKACGPGAPTLASSFAGSSCEATVAKEPGHRGEHEISCKPPRRECRKCFGEPVVTNSCGFLFPTRGCGCAKHPAFPAPSDLRGTSTLQSPGELRRGSAELGDRVPPRALSLPTGCLKFV
jgi:hypothetical protein